MGRPQPIDQGPNGSGELTVPSGNPREKYPWGKQIPAPTDTLASPIAWTYRTSIYWSVLATVEKALLALEPINRIVPTTSTRMTASITAYSAMSCPSFSTRILRRPLITLLPPAQVGRTDGIVCLSIPPQGAFSKDGCSGIREAQRSVRRSGWHSPLDCQPFCARRLGLSSDAATRR